LLTLHNPQLQARREQVAAKLAQAEQTQYAHLGTESAKAGQADQDVNRLSAELDELDQQLSRLQVRAHQDGRLVWPRADDLDGLYAKRGQLLGQVLGAAPPSIKIAVPQADVPLWHRTSQVHAMGRVSMRLQHPGAAAVPAASWRDAMGATQVLPSAALSRDLGGEIATDPSDAQHLRTLRPVVLMDFLPAQPLTDVQDLRLGQRAWVKLDQGWAPPLWQGWRWVRHRALQDLAPSS
jgi:putative peptide zinc metalloprotease protein